MMRTVLLAALIGHILCGVVEWIYIRLGRTNAGREGALEMQIKTTPLLCNTTTTAALQYYTFFLAIGLEA